MSAIIPPCLPSPDELRAVRAQKLRSLPRIAEGVPTRPRALPHLAQEAATLLACAMLLDPADPEAETWLRLLCRALTLQAARRIPGEGPAQLHLPLLGQTSVPRLAAAGLLELREYIDACHAAMALDDTEAMALLARVPLDGLEASPQPSAVGQASGLELYLQKKDFPIYWLLELDTLLAALETERPGPAPPAIPNPADHALKGEVALAKAWEQPREEWEECLRTALGSLRLQGMLDGVGTPSATSFVALGALAFAAMRHASGLSPSPVEPELPPGLVRRSYAGLRGR